jgi:hypothetical protein
VIGQFVRADSAVQKYNSNNMTGRKRLSDPGTNCLVQMRAHGDDQFIGI